MRTLVLITAMAASFIGGVAFASKPQTVNVHFPVPKIKVSAECGDVAQKRVIDFVSDDPLHIRPNNVGRILVEGKDF